MKHAIFLSICCFFLLSVCCVTNGQMNPVVNLDSLPTHPRVLISAKRETEIKELAKQDEFLQALIANQILQADELVQNEKTVQFIIVGPRLLDQSRLCLKRVLTLAGAYRLTDDPAKKQAYKARAMKELSAAASFPNWNPSHFLDTAEMTAAFAIGYDWLYNDLTEDEKTLLVDSIYNKGLVPGLKANHFRNSEFNWNQVCNGGLTMGALAIADVLPAEKKAVAQKIVQLAIQTVPKAMKSFAPDGLWIEGPAYWQYTLLYTTFLVNTLEASLGSDFGLTNAQGFDVTVYSQMALSTPEGGAFNFADAGSGRISNSMDFWLADRFNTPIFAEYERQQIREKTDGFKALRSENPKPISSLYPTNVWLYSPKRADMDDAPLDFYFRKAEIVTMRTKWFDPNAIYVGFKAGQNGVNHGHLDLGSFILVKDGVRWALDLGGDNYNLPGYWGSKRWSYYRLSSRGHNTLVVGTRDQGLGTREESNLASRFSPLAFPQNQNPKGFAPITDYQSHLDKCTATADLSDAYKGQLKSVQRTVTLDRSKKTVTIKDVFQTLADVAGETSALRRAIAWQMHTQATIAISEDGKTALLTQKDKTLTVSIVNSTLSDVRFSIAQTDQTKDEARNTGVSVLTIYMIPTENVEQLEVEFK